jgi:hypothetical protein
MSAFGTSEIDHAFLMLSGIVNAARHGSPKNTECDIGVKRRAAATSR